MKIDIKATDLKMTSPLAEFIEEKIGSLDKFIRAEIGDGTHGNHLVEAFVEVARDTKHHKHGEVFRAGVNLKIGGRVLRAEKSDFDIRVAIDAVREELTAELRKTQGKFESQFKKGARKLKQTMVISPLAWFRRKR